MWEAFVNYIAARFQEPSTYNALGLIATGIGFNIAPDHWQAISMICMIGFGAIGAAMRERKKTTPTEIANVVKEVVKDQALEPVQPSAPVLAAAMKKNGN